MDLNIQVRDFARARISHLPTDRDPESSAYEPSDLTLSNRIESRSLVRVLRAAHTAEKLLHTADAVFGTVTALNSGWINRDFQVVEAQCVFQPDVIRRYLNDLDRDLVQTMAVPFPMNRAREMLEIE